jgi:hypothetical protein
VGAGSFSRSHGTSCPEQIRSALAMRGSSVLKDRWTPLIAWAVLGLAGLACASACGHGLPFTTRYGAVTTLRPQLCISRRAATGTCFGGVSELQIAALTIGECVEVTFDPHTTPGSVKILEIGRAEPTKHRRDCP